jgi:hypothetical protein
MVVARPGTEESKRFALVSAVAMLLWSAMSAIRASTDAHASQLTAIGQMVGLGFSSYAPGLALCKSRTLHLPAFTTKWHCYDQRCDWPPPKHSMMICMLTVGSIVISYTTRHAKHAMILPSCQRMVAGEQALKPPKLDTKQSCRSGLPQIECISSMYQSCNECGGIEKTGWKGRSFAGSACGR